jgi:lipopolysaccharide export system permease protein
MIRILDRYVIREFMRLFLLFALAAPVLFILGDWTDNLDTYTERGLQIRDVALGYVYMFPQFVLWSFPIAALIATVFTVSNMTRHSEMAAAKAGGISFWRATLPLAVLGVLLTAAGLGLSELVPITLRLRAEIMGEEQNSFYASRNDFVYRAEDGTVYGIRRLDVLARQIYGMTIEREGDGVERPTMHAFAKEAQWDSAQGWTLREGFLRLFWPDTPERTYEFQTLQGRDFDETPDELLAEPLEPEEMRYAEMARFIRALERSGGKPYELMFEQAEKIVIPVATLIIILFGAPLANSSHRGGPAYGIGISLGITMVYLVLFRVADAVGTAGIVNPWLAAWAPNVLFFFGAVVLMARVRT